MFKGRTIQATAYTDTYTGIVNFEQLFAYVFQVNGYPIRPGMSLHIQHSYDESPEYDHNYTVYTLLANGTAGRQIGDQDHLFEWFTIADGEVGICFEANDNPSGNYSITINLEIVNTLIDNPIDAIRHIKEHQNWSELGGSYSWGHSRITGSKIRLSGEGSFNSQFLDEIKNLKIARQILNQSEAWTNDSTQSLCEQFFLCNYQDENGYERIKSILTKENPSTIITYRDIKKVGEIIEPRLSDIYCTPIINYAYDYATEKYTKQLRVEKVWESNWQASFTPGMTEFDGEEIWGICHELWLKTRQVEPMPDDMINKIWVPDYNTAIWCLRRHLQLMQLKRCTFTVGYTTGRKWKMVQHHKLQLPHETDNKEVEYVIESINNDVDNNGVSVQIMFLDEISYSEIAEVFEYTIKQQPTEDVHEASDADIVEL